MRTRCRVHALLWIVAGLLITPSPPALAVLLRSGEEVSIGPRETVNDDLYVAAKTLIVDGTIQGDLVAAAQRIIIRGALQDSAYLAARELEISGHVQNDLNAIGRRFTLDCRVGDDVRLAAQTISLDNNTAIDDDFLAACHSLVAKADSLVSGSVLFAAERALLAGRIREDVRAQAPRIRIDGVVEGHVEVMLEGDSPGSGLLGLFARNSFDVARGLTISERASITGDVNYRSFRKARISPNTVHGDVRRSPLASEPSGLVGRVFVGVLGAFYLLARNAMTLVISGALLLFLAPNWTQRLLDHSRKNPFRTLGLGLLSVVGVFIAAVLIFAVAFLVSALLGVCSLGGMLPATVGLGGLAEASLFFTFWVFARYVAPVIICLWAGEWILARLAKRPVENRYLIFLAGMVPVVALTSLWCVGWVVKIVIALSALGALWKWLNQLREARAI